MRRLLTTITEADVESATFGWQAVLEVSAWGCTPAGWESGKVEVGDIKAL